MTEGSSFPDPDSQTARGRQEDSVAGSPPPMPRWVKVFALIVVILLLLVVVVLVTGLFGPHGPGRHIPSARALIRDTSLFGLMVGGILQSRA